MVDQSRDDNKREMLLFQQEQTDAPTSSAFSRRRQVTATLCATIGCLINGAALGYTGPALPSIGDNSTAGDSVWGSNLDVSDQAASWITSLLSIGCFVGCILAGPVMEKLGRKRTLMLVPTINYFVGFLFIILASKKEFLYLGRFLNGIGLGFVLATVSVYIVEIASSDMRGLLGCFVQFQGSIGILLTFCLGVKLNWWQLAAANLLLVLIFFFAMWYIPESPRWLIMKGDEWGGEVALKWLRGRGPEQLDREIEQIKREIAIKKRERVSVTLLLDHEVVKPFIISLLMMFFLQLSGFNVMLFYFVSIFRLTGNFVDPNLASIIVGVVLLLSCFVSLGVVSRLDRKIMLVSSMICMAVCHLTLGFYFYHLDNLRGNSTAATVLPPLNNCHNCSVLPPPAKNLLVQLATEEMVDVGDLGHISWIPLATLVVFLFTGNLGYGTLIWVVTAEILPPRVRSVANSFIICFAFVAGFVVVKTFVDLVQGLGLAGTFWFYGSACLLGAIFTAIAIPETRGKTIEEIQARFRRGGKRRENESPLQTVS